ncbi:TonB-dependent receptor [Pseudoalteromonas piscicida]|uniref:Secretin/TonB short N-terminal domain-containing protein n=1 Tax=Pseudoalteromonas piscicida TaxID=43662 RepID=A0A2A5JVV7_PSEO7|nr:TonB-dependent receptor [Pseudoalteromonas piscicida]PCK33585.1 hypothetical protein CEX98_00760 [Pseudoalteromonas piscicida]
MNKLKLTTVALAAALATQSVTAQANTQVLMLDIQPQSLEQTLIDIAQQSNMTLIFEPELIQSHTAPRLQGPATVRDALTQVLQGSGLSMTIEDNAIILHQSKSSVTATELSAIQVAGSFIAPGMFDESQVEQADLPYLKTSSAVFVDSDKIAQFRGTSAADILKGIPGVQVGESRNGGAIDVNIRGMQGQNRVPVVIDGAIQSTTVYRGYAGISDRAYVDPDLLSTIHINKGPNNSEHGTGAVGGVVVMDTLKTKDIIQAGERTGVRIKAGVQSNTRHAPSDFHATPRDDAPSLLDSDAHFYNIAFASEQEDFSIVLAAANRDAGNYFAGEKDRERYFYEAPASDWEEVNGEWIETKYTKTEEGIARFYKAGEEVLNTANKTRSLLIKPTWMINDNSALEFSYRGFDADYGEIMASQIYRNSGDTLSQWKHSKQDVDAYSLRYQYSSATDPLLKKLKANVWFTTTDSKAYNGNVFGNPLEGKEFTGDHECEACVDILYLAKTQAQRTGVELSNQSLFSFADQGILTLDYGYTFQKEDVGPGDDVHYSQTDLQTNRKHRDGTRYESSLFVQSKWAPTSWLSLELGGRYTWFRVNDHNAYWEEDTKKYQVIQLWDADNNSLGEARWYADSDGNYSDANDPRVTGTGEVSAWGQDPVDISQVDYVDSSLGWAERSEGLGTYTIGETASRRDDGFTANFAINGQLNDYWLGYLRYSEAMRMPSIMESTLGWSVASVIFEVDPERAKNWELGISYIDDALFGSTTSRIKLAYFDNTIDNYITRRTVTDRTLIRPYDVTLTIGNTDEFATKGIEFQSYLAYGPVFADLSATYYTDVKLCDSQTAQYIRDKSGLTDEVPDCSSFGFSGNYVSNHIPPKKAATAILGLNLLDEKLEIGTRITYTGAPETDFDRDSGWQNWHGTAAHTPTESYRLVDVYAKYQLSEHVEVNFHIDNVTNEFYLDALALSLMPGPGRTSKLSVTAKF